MILLQSHRAQEILLRQQQLLLEELLVGGQDLEITRESGIVARARQFRGVLQRNDSWGKLSDHSGEQPDLPLVAL